MVGLKPTYPTPSLVWPKRRKIGFLPFLLFANKYVFLAWFFPCLFPSLSCPALPFPSPTPFFSVTLFSSLPPFPFPCLPFPFLTLSSLPFPSPFSCPCSFPPFSFPMFLPLVPFLVPFPYSLLLFPSLIPLPYSLPFSGRE